jgi:hypothetical protein
MVVPRSSSNLHKWESVVALQLDGAMLSSQEKAASARAFGWRPRIRYQPPNRRWPIAGPGNRAQSAPGRNKGRNLGDVAPGAHDGGMSPPRRTHAGRK